jgi:hypothetical protein
MSYKLNPSKIERVNRFGQTVDLPLFDPTAPASAERTRVPLPSRIYDGSERKAKIFAAIKNKLGPARMKVFEAIFDLRIATDVEIAKRLDWTINRVTPRRKELQQLGLIVHVGEKVGEFGHPNAVWAVNARALRLMLE